MTHSRIQLSSELAQLFAAARQHQQAGRLAEAEPLYRRVLAQRPEFAEAHAALGDLLLWRRKFAEAQRHLEQALALRPDVAEIYNSLGVALGGQGKLDESRARFEQALRIKPAYVDAHNNLANTLAAMGLLEEAAAEYEQTLALKPGFAEAHNNLGNVRKMQNDYDAAVVHYRRALEIKPEYLAAHINLGGLLRDQQQFDEALERFQAALAIDPRNPEVLSFMGHTLKQLGQLEEAGRCYDQALALNPRYAEAHYGRAILKKFKPGDPDLAVLEYLASESSGTSDANRMRIQFALGKALDDLGQYPRAFEQWQKAAAARRRAVQYDDQANAQEFQEIRQAFDAALFERLAGAGDPSPLPIFVIGMPRSGSTLVEQILASHPLVFGAGELTHLNSVAVSVPDAAGRPAPYPAYLSWIDEAGLARIGREYLAKLPAPPAGKPRITDKMPRNFWYAGLIRLILPNAKIVHTVRHPVDTCLSCFSQMFFGNQPFTYDLVELGRYYRRYYELMEHWRSVLPTGSMLDVRYEEVVDDLEGQARRLLDYCGLPWDEACLSFYRTERPVCTASSVQVRQPIYRGSVERWRRYEAQLGPLLAELEEVRRGK